jgi:predicted alpha/beta hydrolase
MRDAIRMQLQHWNLIGGGEFGLAYISSIARFCELNQRAGVAPQWYIGCRLMFVADQLIRAVETEVQVPDDATAAQAARDKKAEMVKAIAKANMLDTEYMMAHCLGANREARNDSIMDAGDGFRASITLLMNASNELERSGRAVA